MIVYLLIIGIILFLIIWSKCGKNVSNNENILKILSRQAGRWSLASKQDKNPIISVLHSNYGAGYLWAIKDISTSEQLNKATGIDILKFEKEIVQIQDRAIKKLIKKCPNLKPKKHQYLSKISGLE